MECNRYLFIYINTKNVAYYSLNKKFNGYSANANLIAGVLQ